jgi:hypothetical protein
MNVSEGDKAGSVNLFREKPEGCQTKTKAGSLKPFPGEGEKTCQRETTLVRKRKTIIIMIIIICSHVTLRGGNLLSPYLLLT